MAAYSLDGVALVTGAASGIGKETAFALAEAGCVGVVFADIDLEGAEAAAKQSSEYKTNKDYRAVAYRVDVTDRKSVQSMVEFATGAFACKRIDYCVNSAGVGSADSSKIASDLDFDAFEHTIDINLKGTAYCVSEIAKAMKNQEDKVYQPKSKRLSERSIGKGVIINMGSFNSYGTRKGTLDYTATKHAVLGITKAAALDHAKDGIRVIAVCPGATDTPMMVRASKGMKGQLDAYASMFIPLWQRMAFTDEIAATIIFLCSPAASYITGTSLIVDAGFSFGHVDLGAMKRVVDGMNQSRPEAPIEKAA